PRYAGPRPRGLWSVLLINKDPQRAFNANILLRDGASGEDRGFAGNVDAYQYSPKQYELGGPANNPYPVKAEEPEHQVIQSKFSPGISLPPYSLTVIRGRVI